MPACVLNAYHHGISKKLIVVNRSRIYQYCYSGITWNVPYPASDALVCVVTFPATDQALPDVVHKTHRVKKIVPVTVRFVCVH